MCFSKRVQILPVLQMNKTIPGMFSPVPKESKITIQTSWNELGYIDGQ